MKFWILLATLAFCSAEQSRDKRMFSLFSVVQFKNDPCVSSSKISSASTEYRNGTCHTNSECIDKSGRVQGNCAAGFGVCCVFVIDTDDNTDVNNNDTYIQNPDFPNSYGDESSITYKVSKISSDICYLRLDFEQFSMRSITVGPNAVCQDYLDVKPSENTNPVPRVCGDMRGQHMYVNMGPDEGDTVDLEFKFDGENAQRKWEVKVAQIPCNSNYSPPDGCLQWFTGPTGRITSFNFGDNLGTSSVLLPNQEYRACVRQEAGFCCVEYSECGFQVDSIAAAGTPAKGASGTNCASDYVAIEGAGGECGDRDDTVGINKFCESKLHFQNDAENSVPICDCTQPFSVGVVTTITNAGAMQASTGFCLDYRQMVC